MSIIFAKLGFGADPAEKGEGALTRMCLSAPHSRKRPLPTFQKFDDTRPGALTRVSTVRMASMIWFFQPQNFKCLFLSMCVIYGSGIMVLHDQII